MSGPVLEAAAQAIADATSKPPFLYEVGVENARKVLDDIQAAPIEKLPVDEKWIIVPVDVGDVRVRVVKPVGAADVLPAVLYVHGGGWVLGNAGTHDRLVRDLAVFCGEVRYDVDGQPVLGEPPGGPAEGYLCGEGCDGRVGCEPPQQVGRVPVTRDVPLDTVHRHAVEPDGR